MRMTLLRTLIVAVAAAALPAAGQRQLRPAETTRRLSERFGLEDMQRASLISGFESVRALPSSAPDGIAAVGAIWIDVPPAAYLTWAEAFADVDRGSNVQAVQKLSNPPRAADFQWLRLSPGDLAELAHCRLGDCEVQLDAQTIALMQNVPWRKPAPAAAAANPIFRELLLTIAQDYLARGNAGLRHYHDTRTPTHIDDHVADLLNEEAAAGDAPQPVIDYLRGMPNDVPAGATSYLYWTTNSFGLKPTTRLNHTVVYRGDGNGIAGVIATKMLYASHYFHGALDLRYVMAEAPDADQFMLVAVTRTRSDGLTGLTGAIIGDKVRRNALQALRKYLRFTKDAVERRHRLERGGA